MALNQSLYQLSADYQYLLNFLDDPDVDEQAIIDTCDSIEGAMDFKADSYAMVIKNIDSDIDALKAEEARLAARRRHLENRKTTMKSVLEMMMRATGKMKFKTTLFSFGIQKNGGKPKLDIHGEVPAEFIKQVPTTDTTAIREALEAGEELEFAVLMAQGESLRIR